MAKHSQIQSIKAKEILDSNKQPTIEIKLKTDRGRFLASVPSGVSAGKHEAIELRDEDGKGVKKAIESVGKVIAPALAGEDFANQGRIDEILVNLDGTKNKSRLGANAILAVSMAVCRAGAKAQNLPLYSYIAKLAENSSRLYLPKPSFNMIEGGKHSDSGLAFQELMAVPQIASFRESLEIGQKIYKNLGNILKKKYGKVKLSAEGGYCVPVDTYAALNLILEAGRNEDIKIAIDAAASSFYQNSKYQFEGQILTREELLNNYQLLVSYYPIISIEDPFYEEDFEGLAGLEDRVVAIFGDDLTVSNVERIRLARDKNACNGLVLKPNQIGTITETIEAAKLAKSYGWKIMVANRAGETKDDFIADLAVGIGADFIKSGAPFPSERMAKYNRLAEIEKELKE